MSGGTTLTGRKLDPPPLGALSCASLIAVAKACVGAEAQVCDLPFCGVTGAAA